MEEKRSMFERRDAKHEEAKHAAEKVADKKPEGPPPVVRSYSTINLTIPNVTLDQANSIMAQLQGGDVPPPQPQPSPDDALKAVKEAPSNWAAYTFCNSAEWAALDGLYGVNAVNPLKNYYQGNYRLPGIVNPGDPATSLREIGQPGPFRYYVMWNGQQSEDTGQADQMQVNITGKEQPTLPIR